jgi:copper homeostasis protein
LTAGARGIEILLIEVIAESVADAVAAEAGGSDRIELVRELNQDGLTPAPQLVREVCSAVGIPVYVMIRPRDSFTLLPEEREQLMTETRAAIDGGARGLVTGYVTGEGEPDLEALALVRDAAGPASGLTFHRATDRLADLAESLPRLATCGVERLLTSGGAATAPEGCTFLRALVPIAARHGLTVMAGGGLTPENVAMVVAESGVHEVHFGAGVRVPATSKGAVSQARVRTACLALGR